MNPKVSVIITCYNYARYLTDAVESVVHQTYKDFDIIIVNDGSTDETQEVAESLIDKYSNKKISLINQVNSGQPAIARNLGIENSKSEYILCLDADDKIEQTMLQECVEVIENNHNIDFVYTDRLDFNDIEEIVPAKEFNFEQLKYENHISYCALFRRDMWEKIGGYRTNVKGCEDWDFWVAAGARGFIGKRVPKALFHYRRHETGVFQGVQWRLHEALAQIVENNAEVYSSEEIISAKKTLTEIQEWKSNSKPTVSVIIPTYNRREQLTQAIKSVLGQTFRDFEIIVINDGGVDIKNLIDDLNRGKNIVYVNLATNRGLPAARNTGIGVARGKYIAYLDDDDIYYPDHLQTLVSFLESTDYKIAYTDSCRTINKKVGGKYIFQSKEQYFSGDFDCDRIFVENYIPVLCFMHERTCFDDVGIFDESLTSHEDWDLWIRMSMKFSIGHVSKLTCEFTWIEDDVRESLRRIEFISTLQTIYDKNHQENIQKPHILETQKKKLLEALKWAYAHINGLEVAKQRLQETLKQKNKTLQILESKLLAMQSNLTWQLLNKYVFKVFDKWLIPFGSKRRRLLEMFSKKSLKHEALPIRQVGTVVAHPTIKKRQSVKKLGLGKNKFALYTNSYGNYFFHEIRDLIASGLRELGFSVDILTEKSGFNSNADWHIVVAPHEFFYLGEDENLCRDVLPENLILVNTEQPSTQWFSLAANYFPIVSFIWDINYDSADRVSEQGFQCDFLPLGFVNNCYLFQEVKQLPENYTTSFLKKDIKNKSFFNEPYINRPIDISFVGCLTPRRDEFFAKAAPVISNYQSYIHFSDGLAVPVVPGLTTHMNTEIVLGLMQRSKIMLNIHHGSDDYFEWHRIVLLGIAQKTLVISESSLSSPIFQPGIHYVETKLQDIPEKIKYYLSTPSGIKEAEAIIEKGYKKLMEECRLTEFLQPLISRLYIAEPQ
jgi:glycosyltransferase involved in cell wall biosynthesis